jgi:hypothetical protein
MVTRKTVAVKKAAPKAKASNPVNTISDNWQAKQDMHTLKEAQTIQADRSRHSAAKNEAKAHIKELSKVVSK